MPFKNDDEKKQYNAEYYKKKRNEILEQKKKYYANNLEKIKEYDKKRDKSKKKEHMRKWEAKNAEKVKLRKHNTYLKYKERYNQNNKIWCKENIGKLREQKRIWREKNKDKVKERMRSWQSSNRDKTRLACRMHHKKYPLLYKIYGIRRRDALRKLNEPLNISNNFIKVVNSKFLNQCFNCKSTEKLSIDHHYPLSKGFPLSINNAVLLCRSCNSSKNNKLPESFYSPEQLTDLQLNYGISKSPIEEKQPSLFEARMPKNLERDNGLFGAMNAA